MVAVARRGEAVALDASAQARMQRARDLADAALEREGGPVYGLSTGVGVRKRAHVGLAEQREFNRRLILNHLVGQGDSAPVDAVRATMVVLANVFARGAGPASPRLAQRVVDALNARRHPQVRLLGSLGQADLAPMADLAHGLLGDAAELEPGEGLALLNNNAFATGLAALAVADCARLLDAALVAGALDLEAFAANLSIVDPAVARERPYAGLATAVAELRDSLDFREALVCAGGVLTDAVDLRDVVVWGAREPVLRRRCNGFSQALSSCFASNAIRYRSRSINLTGSATSSLRLACRSFSGAAFRMINC